jgi:N6-adenosine-specific RNA methylase IME4
MDGRRTEGPIQEACDKAFPKGRFTYDVIYCDPPWPYRGMYSKIGPNMNGIIPAYAQMSATKIRDLPVKDLASPNGCYLLMWSTGPHLSNATQVMKSWGFEFVTVFLYWRKVTKDGKPRLGLGNYTRSCSEYLLIGRRGDRLHHIRREGCHSISQELQSTIRRHSQKPVEAYDVLNRFFSDGASKIELFARPDEDVPEGHLKGWHQWGLDIPGYFRQN